MKLFNTLREIEQKEAELAGLSGGVSMPPATPAPSTANEKPAQNASPSLFDLGLPEGYVVGAKNPSQPGSNHAPAQRPAKTTPAAPAASGVQQAFARAKSNYGTAEESRKFFLKKRWVEEAGKDDLAIENLVQERFTVDGIAAHDRENDWIMIKAKRLSDGKSVTVRGEMVGKPRTGDTIAVVGQWGEDRYGAQFAARGISIENGNAASAAFRFLTDRIDGVGETVARKLLARYGDSLPGALGDARRLRDEAGLPAEKADAIVRAYATADAFEKVYSFLRGYGIGPKTAQRVAMLWGKDALARVVASPWDLYREVQGVGFLTADKIALKTGRPIDDPARIDAALTFALDDATTDGGHCWIRRESLVEHAALALEPPTKLAVRTPAENAMATQIFSQVMARFDTWRQQKKPSGGQWAVVTEVDGVVRVYPVPLWNAEKIVATKIADLMRDAPATPVAGREQIEAAALRRKMKLDPSQILALEAACSNGVSVLTGKPGCGKTTVTKIFLDLLQENGDPKVLCCSPTGKAAIRFKEATGRSASTIHSLLARFGRNAENPDDKVLDCDVLIIDECSMIDIKLMRELLECVRPGTRILLVGDPDQLPPVSPGQPFADFIASATVPTARLTRIHRQGKDSGIINAAHQMLAGNAPSPTPNVDDFQVVRIPEPRDEPEKSLAVKQAAQDIVTYMRSELPQRTKKNGDYFNPIEDAIVLTPMKKGALGTGNLNKLLKEALNPVAADATHFAFKHWRLDIGDRVMHTKNNRKLGVFNGDIGTVIGFEEEELDSGRRVHRAIVQYKGAENDRNVSYDRKLASAELTHAYAITIHKSQGSEFPCAVLACAKEHYVLLERRLIYTGVTRGKELVRLYAQPWALRQAVEKVGTVQRNTGLARLLRETLKPIVVSTAAAETEAWMKPVVTPNASAIDDFFRI
jgi:exodeoxyribonuclease V alpha subunit